jgi:hypothetical protein
VSEYEVNCINKPHRDSPHEHITHVGNTVQGWRITRESAITRIESKKETYYTVDQYTRKRVYIGVVREAGKAPYLRTYADGQWNNNLLAQQECGANCRIV